MKILLDQVSKRYRKQFIFRHFSYQFIAPKKYALLGDNGSGKSTLLRSIAAMQNNTSGTVTFEQNGTIIKEEQQYQHISFCAPGMELIEEMTLDELLKFHFSFVAPLPGFTIEKVIQTIGLKNVRHKLIEEYSSGMKQRIKLAQAFFSNRPILLLDEPCSNLDDQGVAQYHQWIEQYANDKLVIVASNDPREYHFCEAQIHLKDWQ